MLRTHLRINWVGLVGAARLSPERTGKVGMAANIDTHPSGEHAFSKLN